MPLGAILRIHLKLRKGRVNNVLFVFHTIAAHKSDCSNEKKQHSYLDSTLLNTMFGSIFSLPS